MPQLNIYAGIEPAPGRFFSRAFTTRPACKGAKRAGRNQKIHGLHGNAIRSALSTAIATAVVDGRVVTNSTVSSANYFSEAPPRGASSQPREREARTDTPTHPPSPRRTAPQPRASPGGGRPAAIPHRLGRTRAGSKLSAGPPRGAAQHRQPQNGAERACGASTVKIRLHFLASGIPLMLVNLKVANYGSAKLNH